MVRFLGLAGVLLLRFVGLGVFRVAGHVISQNILVVCYYRNDVVQEYGILLLKRRESAFVGHFPRLHLLLGNMAAGPIKGASRTSRRWCFTLQQSEYKAGFPVFSGSMKYLVGQEEKAPTTGQVHIQGYVHFKERIGLKKAKEYLGFGGAHMEIAKGSEQENKDYCTKKESRVEGGWSLEAGEMTKAGERVDLCGVKKKIEEGATFFDLTEDAEAIKVAARYGHFVDRLIAHKRQKDGMDEMKQLMEDVELRPWQGELCEVVSDDPDPRKVHWVVDIEGNCGKSFLCQYLMTMAGACVLSPARLADMAYLYSKHVFPKDRPRIVCFDCTRTEEKDENAKFDPLDSVYKLIESLKNGFVQSTKYEPVLVAGRCHVLAFSNFLPNLKKLSQDRWRLYRVQMNVLSVVPTMDGAAASGLNGSLALDYHQ